MRDWALIAVLLVLVYWLTGCAGETRIVKVPRLVAPSCEVPNVFEKCKEICLRGCDGAVCHHNGRQAKGAIETDKSFECICGLWDT